MANTVKIIYTCSTPDGDKNFSYTPAKSSASLAQVKAAGNALVTNGSIFENVPTAVTAAKLVTTTETAYDLSE